MKMIMILIAIVQLCGCASMNVLQLEDAETEASMSIRAGGFVGAGPNFYSLYHDSLRTPGAISFMAGASGKIGLLDWVDVGGGVWTNTLPPVGLLLAGVVDVGGRLDIKAMLTPRDWRHRLAVTGNAGGYWYASTVVDYGDAGKGTTSSIGAGLIYSWLFARGRNGRQETSIYTSLRRDRYTSHYIYDTGDSLRRSRWESDYSDGVVTGQTIALGIRTLARDNSPSAGALEVAATFIPNPWTGKLDWILFAGVGGSLSLLLQ
jgi:hypothetical protein